MLTHLRRLLSSALLNAAALAEPRKPNQPTTVDEALKPDPVVDSIIEAAKRRASQVKESHRLLTCPEQAAEELRELADSVEAEDCIGYRVIVNWSGTPYVAVTAVVVPEAMGEA